MISTKRSDRFAVEGERNTRRVFDPSSHSDILSTAYETSLYLAVLFDSPRQTTSVLSHLIQDLYAAHTTHLRSITILISLLHHLVAAYPSQNTFRQHIESLPPSLLSPTSELYLWMASLASSLRSLNYFKFEQLTRPHAFSHLLVSLQEPEAKESPASSIASASIPDSFQSSINLATEATHVLVDSLRTKAREKTWQIIRSAYREFASHPESKTTRQWLERSLALTSVVPGARGIELDQWLDKKSEEGQLRKKDGAADGRWIICKVR